MWFNDKSRKCSKHYKSLKDWFVKILDLLKKACFQISWTWEKRINYFKKYSIFCPFYEQFSNNDYKPKISWLNMLAYFRNGSERRDWKQSKWGNW